MNEIKKKSPSAERFYVEAEKSFLINFGSRRLKPIRISLPTPPPLEYIDGYGLPPSEQYFRRKEFPQKIIDLERECYESFNDKKYATHYDIRKMFWELLEKRKKKLKDEIKWMKHFIWHMYYGYWFFNDGQPTYISGWNFSYLHLHFMTLKKGEGYPEYDDRIRRRFLFRKYIHETTETFMDIDEKGKAYKVDGVYRMKDIGIKTFYGTIEPKGRREGLTNEFCHIITRIMTETIGSDNLGTIVSMDGDNAQTHFKKKLLPAFKKWPVWLKPIWKGGLVNIEFETPKSVLDPSVKVLGSSIDFTNSGSDLANDGKKIMAAGFDEQGKGKRIGDVGNRWQINKETMSVSAGADILGFCMHPSTVEKMEEGGQDYKEMCNLSDFYTRGEYGQTLSGLSISYMPSSYCLRGFTDRFGKAVLHRPTKRQIALGYKREIGSQTFIQRRRNQLYDETDPEKMDEFRSFVRKYPEDYEDCWKGISGYLGFPVEKMEERLLEIENRPHWVRGRFEWVANIRFGNVYFIEDPLGDWVICKKMKPEEANLKSSMDYYSALEDDWIPMYRPMYPTKGIIGLDPHEFNNKGVSMMLKNKQTKLSDTGLVAVQRRDKTIDKNDFDKKSWKTQKAVAVLETRFPSNEMVAEEALKAAIYYGYLINLERNKTEVFSHLIKWKYGGYLNHRAEILSVDGKVQIDPQPGVYLSQPIKKRLFTLTKDQLVNHIHIEDLPLIIKQAIKISSMEELTKYDALAAYMLAIDGLQSIYAELIEGLDDGDITCVGIQGRRV